MIPRWRCTAARDERLPRLPRMHRGVRDAKPDAKTPQGGCAPRRAETNSGVQEAKPDAKPSQGDCTPRDAKPVRSHLKQVGCAPRARQTNSAQGLDAGHDTRCTRRQPRAGRRHVGTDRSRSYATIAAAAEGTTETDTETETISAPWKVGTLTLARPVVMARVAAHTSTALPSAGRSNSLGWLKICPYCYFWIRG